MTAWALLLVLAAPPGGVSSDDLEAFEAAWRRSRKACGPVALSYCLHRLGRRVSSAELAEQMEIGDAGVSASDLLALARRYEPSAQALRGSPTNYEALPIPSILILDSRHCVVFDGINDDGNILIFEPADGRRKAALRHRLSEHWSGEVLVFAAPAMSWPRFGAWALLSFCAVLLSAAFARSILRQARVLR